MKNNISESKIIIENGKVKTIFSEEFHRNGGWMATEEAKKLTIQYLAKSRKLRRQQNASKG